jgi:hypothetical protein
MRDDLYETPAHLYPHALVADETGGADDAAGGGDADEFVMPEDITGLSAEFDDEGVLVDGELHDLLTQARAAFDRITGQDGGVDAAGLAAATAVAEHIESIAGDAARRVTEAATVAEAVADLQARVNGETAETDADADGDGDGDGGAGGDDGGDGGDGTGDGGGEGGTGEGATTEPELVTAGAGGGGGAPRRISLAHIARHAPTPQADRPESNLVITAAAEVPGFAAGAPVPDLDAVVAAAHGRARALGKTNGATASVATFHFPDAAHVLTERDNADTMMEALRAASDPAHLLAAGGWCAPDDRIWEFFSLEGMTGLFDLPSVTVARGGLEWPVSPSIGDLWAQGGLAWVWTETLDEEALENDGGVDDVTKPCFRIPCGTFDDERLAMWGICISAGNLSTLAWPEQNRRYVDLALAANAHLVSARLIAAVVAGSVAAAPVAVGAGVTAPLLAAIELQVLDYRSKYRMPETALLEAVFPSWITAVIRADLANRAGVSDLLSVTNAQITGWFRDRGIVPQFVADWQPLHPLNNNPAVVTSYPVQVQFLLYAAGTWVRGRGKSLDLGVVRDSALNEVNDHILMWTEEGNLVAKVGHESRLVTVQLGDYGAAFCCEALVS